MLADNSPSPVSNQDAAEPDEAIVLRICRAASGKWSGKLLIGGTEVGDTVAGYDSPKQVEQAAYDSGFYPDKVEIDQSHA